MDRRTFLATIGVGTSIPAVGCLGAFGESDTAGDGSGDGENDGESDDGDADDGETDDGETGIHHLFLVNLDDAPRRIDLEVVDRGENEPVIEGTYELPDERGGEFREVAAWDETYEVRATLESGVSETFAWEIERCPATEAEGGESESETGSRNASVGIEPNADDLSFVTDSCDEIVAGTAVPVGPARQFVVEETD